MKLTDIGTLNVPGVFALIHPVKKKVYLGCSKSILKAVTRLVDDLKTNKAYSGILEDYNELEFCIMSVYPKANTMAYLRLKLGHTRYKLEASGYTFYNSDKGLLLRTNTYLGTDGLVYVEVVSSSNKRVIVGVFKRVPDADSFVANHYTGHISEIVYADNRFTDRIKQGLKPVV